LQKYKKRIIKMSDWILNDPEALDLLQSLGIPCDICGDILCDGFCDEELEDPFEDD